MITDVIKYENFYILYIDFMSVLCKYYCSYSMSSDGVCYNWEHSDDMLHVPDLLLTYTFKIYNLNFLNQA